jgi:hypothetical protein
MLFAAPHYCQADPGSHIFKVMPAYHYSDAFVIVLEEDDGRTLEELLSARGTGWPERILARSRDALVAPFGLKPIGGAGMAPFETIERHVDEVIYGVDDVHANVRIGYRLAEGAGKRTLTATTLVRTNNTFGRLYLLSILPFHMLIVRRQLKRIAAKGACALKHPAPPFT